MECSQKRIAEREEDMKHRCFQWALAPAACGLFAFSMAAWGQNGTGTASRMTSSDSTFATKAAQGGLAEVQLGNLAEQNASSQDVKDFGQRMVKDHTNANDELKQIAQQQNLTLPTGMNAKDQAVYNRLSKLHGAAFDQAYMRDMVNDHKMDIREFQQEANHGTDPQLKQFASKTLPTLQQHLQMAQLTQSKIMK
jgi:putative membrane protein